MAPDDKHKLLAALKRNKRNRRVEDAQKLLSAFGFHYRAATKEQGGVWQRGSYTLTLPFPHGSGDKSLAPRYLSMVIRVIESAEASHEQDETIES
jgi:hypothetical protein